MNSSIGSHKSALSYVERALGLIGLITILLVTLSVFTRFVMEISITWSDEVLRVAFIWSYFIGTAMQYKEGGLMRLELLDEMLKNNGNKKSYLVICFIQDALLLVFSSFVSYYSIMIIKGQIISKQMSTTSGTPAWFPTLGFAIGMCLLMIFSIQKLYSMLKIKGHNLSA